MSHHWTPRLLLVSPMTTRRPAHFTPVCRIPRGHGPQAELLGGSRASSAYADTPTDTSGPFSGRSRYHPHTPHRGSPPGTRLFPQMPGSPSTRIPEGSRGHFLLSEARSSVLRLFCSRGAQATASCARCGVHVGTGDAGGASKFWAQALKVGRSLKTHLVPLPILPPSAGRLCGNC